MKVKVYFNLHKKTFSIMDLKTRRVVRYADDVTLRDVTFKVSEAGRQRVLREKRKNVHAYVIGKIDPFPVDNGREVTYNPYKYKTFVFEQDKSPVRYAKKATLTVNNKKGKILI